MSHIFGLSCAKDRYLTIASSTVRQFISLFLAALTLVAIDVNAQQDPLPTAADIRDLAKMVQTQCLKSTAGLQEASKAAGYSGRVAGLTLELQPPATYCSCVSRKISAIPPASFRDTTPAKIRALVGTQELACLADLWRQGFGQFCVSLGSEMKREFHDRLNVDTQRSEEVCACAGRTVQSFTNQEMGSYIANSLNEISTVLSAPNAHIEPSRKSMSGVFATCGATSMANAFGLSGR